jgi:hypothetical protein
MSAGVQAYVPALAVHDDMVAFAQKTQFICFRLSPVQPSFAQAALTVSAFPRNRGKPAPIPIDGGSLT